MNKHPSISKYIHPKTLAFLSSHAITSKPCSFPAQVSLSPSSPRINSAISLPCVSSRALPSMGPSTRARYDSWKPRSLKASVWTLGCPRERWASNPKYQDPRVAVSSPSWTGMPGFQMPRAQCGCPHPPPRKMWQSLQWWAHYLTSDRLVFKWPSHGIWVAASQTWWERTRERKWQLEGEHQRD